MVNPIPESVRKIWDNWNIRGVILLSLSLQIILIFFAPLRKSTANKLIITLIWSVYLLADWSAIFALGLISNSQKDTPNPSTPAENSDLLAFWAPFLLLHLGGPDNITAFALEDNELWLRHFVGLLIQAVATLYIFLLSLPKTKLSIPTILMFIAGSIKYLERSRAFYLARFDGFQDSISRKPEIITNENVTIKSAHVQAIRAANYLFTKAGRPDPDEMPVQLENETEVVRCAYKKFETFKGLIANLIFSFSQHQRSQKFFRRLSPEQAYRIVEVELNFIYEILYTKVQVVYSLAGCIRRFISFGLVVAAFSVFHFKVKKHGFNNFDVAITYTLFSGAIALDIIALFILVSFDLTSGALNSSDNECTIKSQKAVVLNWILNLKKPRWYTCDNDERKHEVLATPFLFGRWSGYVSRYNLLSYCLKRRPTRVLKYKNGLHRWIEKIIHSFIIKVSHATYLDRLLHFLNFINDLVISWLGLDDHVDSIRYVTHEPLTKEVWVFIFNELKKKSELAKNPKIAMKISSTRGKSILKDKYDCLSLFPYVTQVTYDEGILLWHIATELLYQTDHKVSDDREISKILSDYMLYLLIMQPTIMFTVIGIAKIRFKDTCAQTRTFIEDQSLKTKAEEETCKMILSPGRGYYLPMPKSEISDDHNKSVLYKARKLAKELTKLDDKWKLISKIWMEMLTYAASSSGSRVHAQQVNRGGELISFIWLLMVHFGLQRQFQNIRS